MILPKFFVLTDSQGTRHYYVAASTDAMDREVASHFSHPGWVRYEEKTEQQMRALGVRLTDEALAAVRSGRNDVFRLKAPTPVSSPLDA